jgi:hypothetical protein
LIDKRNQLAVEVAERYADGEANGGELAAAHEASLISEEAIYEICSTDDENDITFEHWFAAQTASLLTYDNLLIPITTSACEHRAAAIVWCLNRIASCYPDDEELRMRSAIAERFRHVAGSPFRKPPLSGSWPTVVIHLAEAMYAGQDCHHYALCDALLDAGHEELAEHFREPGHPKGCWALDFILGKSSLAIVCRPVGAGGVRSARR